MNRKYCYCFFGDSITEGIGSEKRYTAYLEEMADAEFKNYGVNGAVSIQALDQIHKMEDERSGDFDCAVIFMGTNDFNSSIALGAFYSEHGEDVPCGLNADGSV